MNNAIANNALAIVAVTTSPLIANVVQSNEGSIIGGLIQGGTTGAMLAWFMWRNERRMSKLEAAWNHYSKVRLLSICAGTAAPPVKAEAEALLTEIKGGTVTPFAGK